MLTAREFYIKRRVDRGESEARAKRDAYESTKITEHTAWLLFIQAYGDYIEYEMSQLAAQDQAGENL